MKDITSAFTDTIFLEKVYEAVGKTAPEPVYDTDAAEVEELDVSGSDVKNLQGIEYFTALKFLYCRESWLRELDLRSNTELIYLDIYDSGDLAKLLLGKNNLTSLGCEYMELQELDVSGMPKLEELCCSHNHLTALDVSHNPDLKHLSCSNNRLTALDVSKLTKLQTLNCAENHLTRLDLTQNPVLQELDYCGNYIPDESQVPGLAPVAQRMNEKLGSGIFVQFPQKEGNPE